MACRNLTWPRLPPPPPQPSTVPLVAGSQAEALIAARGGGTALPLWPDARRFPLLPQALIGPADQPLYGRAPDARLPAA